MEFSKLYPEDNLSVKKIKKLVYAIYNPDEYEEMWSDMLLSYQMICVKWLIDECEEREKEINRLRKLCLKSANWLTGEGAEDNAEFIAGRLLEESGQ